MRSHKILHKYTLAIVTSLMVSQASLATDYVSEAEDSGATSNVATYLYNLGTYLGFNLTNAAQSVNSTLLNLTTEQTTEVTLYYVIFGAVPVNTFASVLSYFVPSDDNNQVASTVNSLGNATFKYQSYSSPSSGTISANDLLDQTNTNITSSSNSASTGGSYQNDPVTQSTLNILTTPDYSVCMNYDQTEWVDSGGNATYNTCNYKYQFQVMENVIGTLPTAYDFYSYDSISPFLSQLNSETLLSPLLYNTSDPGSSSSSSSGGLSNSSQNQAVQAQNFIRYATSEVLPISLAQISDYDSYYQDAIRDLNASPTPSNDDIINTKSAQSTLARYLAQIRVYAAQRSVAVSNLYYILSKRMPQTPPSGSGGSSSSSGSSSQPTSQALSEFQLATWRLVDPQESSSNQWISQINAASTATVQKEIAVLLSEINYQLYLQRQQMDRLLLTNSMVLMQGLVQNVPDSTIDSEGTAPSSSSSSSSSS